MLVCAYVYEIVRIRNQLILSRSTRVPDCFGSLKHKGNHMVISRYNFRLVGNEVSLINK